MCMCVPVCHALCVCVCVCVCGCTLKMSDVQAVMWMCAPLCTHSVHVWTSLVDIIGVCPCDIFGMHSLQASYVAVPTLCRHAD